MQHSCTVTVHSDPFPGYWNRHIHYTSSVSQCTYCRQYILYFTRIHTAWHSPYVNFPRVQMYKNMMAAARGIVRQQGPWGLFNGISPTIAEIIPYAGMQYGFYDVFKHALLVRQLARHCFTSLCHAMPRRCGREITYSTPLLVQYSTVLGGMSTGVNSPPSSHSLSQRRNFTMGSLVVCPHSSAGTPPQVLLTSQSSLLCFPRVPRT